MSRRFGDKKRARQHRAAFGFVIDRDGVHTQSITIGEVFLAGIQRGVSQRVVDQCFAFWTEGLIADTQGCQDRQLAFVQGQQLIQWRLVLARVFMHRAGGVPIAFNGLWVLRGDAARDGLQGARGGGGQCQIVVQAGAMSELGVYVAQG